MDVTVMIPVECVRFTCKVVVWLPCVLSLGQVQGTSWAKARVSWAVVMTSWAVVGTSWIVFGTSWAKT